MIAEPYSHCSDVKIAVDKDIGIRLDADSDGGTGCKFQVLSLKFRVVFKS